MRLFGKPSINAKNLGLTPGIPNCGVPKSGIFGIPSFGIPGLYQIQGVYQTKS